MRSRSPLFYLQRKGILPESAAKAARFTPANLLIHFEQVDRKDNKILRTTEGNPPVDAPSVTPWPEEITDNEV